jgi:hypothetical protein
MANPRNTHYDELGVPRDATPIDIQRAYNKLRKSAEGDHAIPDPQRERRMQAAYDTLSDPQKREAYDAMLSAPRPRQERERTGSSKGLLVMIAAVAVVGAAGAGFFLMKRGGPPPADTEQLTNLATLAVGRVDSVDLSGKSGPVGLAFAIDENIVATTCNGITPTSQYTLFWPPRTVAAQVAQIDTRVGVCKLSAVGIGGRPLVVTKANPAIGEEVYATKMNPAGVVSLVPAKVTRVTGSGDGKIVEISVKVQPEMQGSPVMNGQGRVIGVAVLPDPAGKGQVVGLSPDWALRTKLEPAPTPAPAQPAPAAQPEGGIKTREQIQAERREAVEKAVEQSVK